MKKERYQEQDDCLKEMNRDVATELMGWKYDDSLKEYYFMFNGDRYKVCDEDEFDPIGTNGDTMEVLEKFENKYDIELNIATESGMTWYCKLHKYDWENENHLKWSGEGADIGFALCEALLKTVGIDYGEKDFQEQIENGYLEYVGVDEDEESLSHGMKLYKPKSGDYYVIN